nr:Phage protein [Kibdelosporangium sp. MJ126-NF4]
MTVPYVARWSEEQDLSSALVIRRRGGIGYVDEVMGDRDQRGILWPRLASRPQHGRPLFGAVHSLRQRRVMSKLLCQVCAGPADRNDDGVLWLLADNREQWADWPERMAVDEPPVCRACAVLASKLCPALRGGAVVARVRQCPMVGVRGRIHQTAGLLPVPTDEDVVAFDDHRIRWTLASSLLRELRGCSVVELG